MARGPAGRGGRYADMVNESLCGLMVVRLTNNERRGGPRECAAAPRCICMGERRFEMAILTRAKKAAITRHVGPFGVGLNQDARRPPCRCTADARSSRAPAESRGWVISEIRFCAPKAD